MLDGWEGFVSASEEHDGGRTVDVFLGLLRDATSIGMTVLIAGDRTTLAPRLAGIVSRRFVLRLVDRADYALAGIPPHHVPLRMPPGRAIRSDDHAEVQFAVLGRDPSYRRAMPSGRRDCRSDQAQDDSAGDHLATVAAPGAARRFGPSRAGSGPTLGVGGDGAEPIRLDLFASPGTFLVAGPPRSGRTTALTVLGKQLESANIEILVAAPARSELARFAYLAGLVVCDVDASANSLPVASRGRRVILIDDAETVRRYRGRSSVDGYHAPNATPTKSPWSRHGPTISPSPIADCCSRLSAAELDCYFSRPQPTGSFLVCVFGALGRARFRGVAYWWGICRASLAWQCPVA